MWRARISRSYWKTTATFCVYVDCPYGRRTAGKRSSFDDWAQQRMRPTRPIGTRPPEVAANILICLIHQTNYLLDQLIRQLEKAFLQEGGLRERMTRARLAERGRYPRR